MSSTQTSETPVEALRAEPSPSYWQAAGDHDYTIRPTSVPNPQSLQFGVLGVDSDGRILRFSEKPDAPELLPGSDSRALASMGFYVFNSDFLYKHLDDGKQGKSLGDDFGKDVIPALVKGHKIMSYSFRDAVTQEPAYWRDVGTLDAFWQSKLELIGENPPMSSSGKTVTLTSASYYPTAPLAKTAD